MINRKGEVYNFIKNNKKIRTKDINTEFGDNGVTQSAMQILKSQKMIVQKPFECGTCKYWVVVK